MKSSLYAQAAVVNRVALPREFRSAAAGLLGSDEARSLFFRSFVRSAHKVSIHATPCNLGSHLVFLALAFNSAPPAPVTDTVSLSLSPAPQKW